MISGHVQRADLSRLYDLIFTENTLTSVQTGEAVVSRDDDAGSCSQAQSSVEGALYGIVVSELRGADQSVHAGESNLRRQNPPPTHIPLFSIIAQQRRWRLGAALEPRCAAETVPEPRFTTVAALEPRCAAAAVAAAATVSYGRTSS